MQKWCIEKRIVHCAALAGEVKLRILGRIDRVENDVVQISQTNTKTPLGDRTFIEFPIGESTTVEYSNAAHMKGFVLSTLKGHDAVLTIRYRSGGTVGLDVLSPMDELIDA